jgi:hypothetical protein
VKVLERLGLRFEKMVRLGTEELQLFALEA